MGVATSMRAVRGRVTPPYFYGVEVNTSNESGESS